jgi:hypothetical protein
VPTEAVQWLDTAPPSEADNRSLVLFDRGDEVTVQAGEEGIRFLLVSGKPLEEPVAWYGPIVMNTQEQLQEAFIVKNFVKEVFGETKACRKTGRLRLTSDGKASDVDFLITVAPVADESEPLALLILDDAAELSGWLHPRDRPATPAASSPDSKARAKAPGRKTDSS